MGGGKRGSLSREARRIALIVSGAFFIEQLDTTIIATAIPQIAEALQTDPLHLNLAMTAYMLGLAIVVPVSGYLADRFGSRRVFAFATALFLLASLLCGLAGNATVFIAARFLQGVGGALMAPIGRLIVMRSVSRSEMVEAMAWVMMPAFVAPLIGPAVGGVIVTWASWRWIFLINIPLGLVAIGLILSLLPDDGSKAARRFDPVGAILVGACFASAAMAFESAANADFIVTCALALLAASLLAVYMLHARRHPNPLLDLGLLALPNYRRAMLAGSAYRIAVGGVPFLLPVALQVAHGFSALASGFVVLLPALGGLIMKFFSTALLRRHGFRPSLLLHSGLSAVFLACIAAAQPSWPAWIVGAVLVLFGLSRSLLMNVYGTLAYAEVARERMGDATSFFLAIQNLTTGMGVAFAALATRAAQELVPTLPATTHFAAAFAALSACALASMVLASTFASDAGAELVNRTAAPFLKGRGPI